MYGDGSVVQAPTDSGGNRNTSTFQHGDVAVTQTLSLSTNPQTGREDAIRISYVLHNTGTVAHDVGLRAMLDTELNYNDGAPFRVPGEGAVTHEETYDAAAVPQNFQVFYDLSDASHVAAATLTGADAVTPDTLKIASWPDIKDTLWEYTTDSSRSITSDSAYAAYWSSASLGAGQTATYTTYYGVGDVDVDLAPPLALGVSGPAQLNCVNDEYSPNPFDITATVLNNGSATATDVTVDLALPSELTLASGTAQQSLGDIEVGSEKQASWSVSASPQSTEASVTLQVMADASNADPKTVSRTITLPPCGGTVVGDVPGAALDPWGHKFFLDPQANCPGNRNCDALRQAVANRSDISVVGFAKVFGNMPDRLRTGASCPVTGDNIGWPHLWIRCFSPRDTGGTSTSWLTQGIGGSDEWRTSATPGGGARFLIASWCRRASQTTCTHNTQTDTRVSLINTASNTYRNVHLTIPTWRNGPKNPVLGIHAGGVAVAGRFLYVADTNRVFVFNLNYYFSASGQYTLPVWDWFKVRGGSNLLSSVSVDGSGTTPFLVGAQYQNDRNTPAAVVRWPMTRDGHLLIKSGTVTSGDSYLIDSDSRIDRVQGVASAGGTYLFSTSDRSIERTRVAHTRGYDSRCIEWGRGPAEDLYASKSGNVVVGINEQPYVRSFWAVSYRMAFGIVAPPWTSHTC